MKSILLLIVLAGTAPAQVPRILLPEIDPSPGEELNSPVALADRIAKNSKSVSDQLADERTGKNTLRDQKQVKDDLDALIRLLDQPPPSASSSSSSSSGSPPMKPNRGEPEEGDSSPQPKNDQQTSKGGQSKPQGRQPLSGSSKFDNSKPGQRGSATQSGYDPKSVAAGREPGKGGPSLPMPPLEESLARDFWGHLPDTQRQQMMQFYREQYMTKYKYLLAEYYKSLAEKEKGK